MLKMLSFCLYLIINKKDIKFVHKLLDSPLYSYKYVYNEAFCFKSVFLNVHVSLRDVTRCFLCDDARCSW